MNANVVLSRVREICELTNEQMIAIFELGGYSVSESELTAWQTAEGEPQFVLCEDEKLARFLNGLIIKNRGPKDDETPEPESALTNNMILQKLRIALSLQADDLINMLKLSERPLSKHELSALFRRPGNKHYRECTDQLLGDILDGMERHF